MPRTQRLLLGIAAVTGLVFGSTAFTTNPAQATLSYTGVCPPTLGHDPVGGAGTGNATDCNVLIVWHPDGSITTELGPESTYEGIEDALIGIVNNSGHSLASFHLSQPGSSIFGFDGDGINIYVLPLGPTDTSGFIANNDLDTTGYGGPLVWFNGTNGTLDAGDVNIDPLASNPGLIICPQFTPNSNDGVCNSTYFSLEHPASLDLRVTAAPEPATLSILGAALVGFGLMRRRRHGA